MDAGAEEEEEAEQAENEQIQSVLVQDLDRRKAKNRKRKLFEFGEISLIKFQRDPDAFEKYQ